MKSILDQATRDELIKRVHSLNDDSQAQWGKMNVYQMIRHCSAWEEMVQGNQTYNRGLLGRIFGKLVLKKVLKDEQPLGRNSPTIPQLKISGNGDVAREKATWIARIEAYAQFSKPEFVHVFFGKMTREQVGQVAYKHADHHLRQFGA